MNPVVLFEDSAVARLDPLALGRPAFSLLAGGGSLAELIAAAGRPIRATVRPHLREVLTADDPQSAFATWPASGPLLALNARVVPQRAVLAALDWLESQPRSIVILAGDALAAAWLPEASLNAGRRAGLLRAPPTTDGVPQQLRALVAQAQADSRGSASPTRGDASQIPAFELFARPHDLVRWQPKLLSEHLAARIGSGELREAAEGVFLAEGAALGPHLVAETAGGPIVVERGARIGPFCFLRGPVLIGRNSRVNEHAAIKDAVTLGHTTKVGGEVEGSIIEPYSNKQHFGFLGHAYVGRWVNLGAGTTNSDLKNTYGPVAVTYGGEKLTSGMQFLGCMIADYAKTAIQTSIFTGKVVGFASMLYGTVTANVPSFVNYARSLGELTEVAAEVVVTMQQRMFARRGLVQRPCDAALVRAVFDLTMGERDYPCHPPAL